jgi:phosphopentomutase
MSEHTPEHDFDVQKRVLVLVMDGMGVGELPDAHLYGDEGSCTLGNMARAVGGLHLPHLGALGLGNIIEIMGVPPVAKPQAAWGKMAEKATGKDTTSGHWEMTGVTLHQPFPTYPDGFPPEVIELFEKQIGRRVLGNKKASGTEIIAELGAEQMATGYPIVYTSADSVFQVAAHEEIIPVPELYRICEIARAILTGSHAVGRVIARPFIGEPGHFVRTPRRHDLSVAPPRPTLLEKLNDAGHQVVAVGKVSDVFAGRGVTQTVKAGDNPEIMKQTLQAWQTLDEGLVFATLVDFDMLWGHRNDAQGLAHGLEEFDQFLPHLIDATRPGDLIAISADHGVDPTTPSTDHSREYVPLLVTGPPVHSADLGIRDTMADLGATLAEYFGVSSQEGDSFSWIWKRGDVIASA